MVFVIELARWFDTQKEMMLGIIGECYAKKEHGEYFRTKSFFASAASGENIKIIIRFDGGQLSAIETHKYPRQAPNWLFPFMLTEDGKNKHRFFRDKAEMLAALKNGVKYTLATTSETLLNKQGSIAFFTLQKDGNILVVDGVKHNL